MGSVSKGQPSDTATAPGEPPPGESPLFGGDVLIRSEALRQAGNWSATTINAEDIDLAFRVRNWLEYYRKRSL